MNGSWPAVKTRLPDTAAGTYAPAGVATGGSASPSSARRSATLIRVPFDGALQVGDEPTLGAGDDLHEFPAL